MAAYLRDFVKRTVCPSFELHFVERELVEDAVGVVEVARVYTSECAGKSRDCGYKSEHFWLVCVSVCGVQVASGKSIIICPTSNP